MAKRLPFNIPDYRRMFDETADQFDAVVVATPDHAHAIIAAAALRGGGFEPWDGFETRPT